MGGAQRNPSLLVRNAIGKWVCSEVSLNRLLLDCYKQSDWLRFAPSILHLLITYLLQHEPVINDGDTIGVSQTERISVHLMKSKHFQGTPVFVAILETIT